ncbi:MAG: hypothetical protein Q9N02_01180 [Ghiorsea sp.]|nr:hypothetical protein [Ghiorsea sp.]
MNGWVMIAILPLAWRLWRVGFGATQRMRVEKNKSYEQKMGTVGVTLPKV